MVIAVVCLCCNVHNSHIGSIRRRFTLHAASDLDLPSVVTNDRVVDVTLINNKQQQKQLCIVCKQR